MTDVRPCERFCEKCRQWLHHSRFRRSFRQTVGHRSVSHFKPICKACEQIERNNRKNRDRPLAIIHRRAADRAGRLGVSRQFMLVNLNWRALVPLLRAMLSPEGRCLNCGHPFLNERDIQIDHIEPPRSLTDYAREHARNLRFICQSCNGTKGPHPNAEWLDRQEDARQSNLREVGEAEIMDGVVDRTAPLLPWFQEES